MRFCCGILSWLLLAGPAYGLEVCFLKVYREDGTLVQLEPEGQFFHAAMRVGDHWLHAYPPRVVLTSSLEGYGHRAICLYNHDVPEPSESFVRAWIGKPFDLNYNWIRNDATYCSKLIANYLGIQPRPASFKSAYWTLRRIAAFEVGLSPDDLYRELRRRGFRRSHCERLMAPSKADARAS